MNVFRRLLNVYNRRYAMMAVLTLAWFLLYPIWKIVNFYQYAYAYLKVNYLERACDVVMKDCAISFGTYVLVGVLLYFLLLKSIYSHMKKAQWGAWIVQGFVLSLVHLVIIWMFYLYFLMSVLPFSAFPRDPEFLLSSLLYWLCPLFF